MAHRPIALHPRPIGLVAVLVTVALLGLGCSSKEETSLGEPATSTTSATSTTEDASPPASCESLGPGQSLVATASDEGQLPIYAAPGDSTPTSTMANPRLINNDPGAPVPLTFLVADVPEDQNCEWVKVFLPVRPNGSTGWLDARDLSFAVNDYRIEVSLGEFVLRLFRADEQVEQIPVGVAADNTPTPGGLYYTTELIKTPNPDGSYGPYAFGLSGFSDTLMTFNGGPGQLGIHGTNKPEAIGTKVSNGCIRMANADITRLAQTLPLGTPVQIDV